MFGLKRSLYDRRVAGVLGGIAERFHIDSKVLRITYLIGIFFTSGLLIPGYFFAMLVMKKPDNPYVSPYQRFTSPYQQSQRPRKEAKHIDDWSEF